jgi:uncharacterized phage-like protein YoqJ
MKEKTVCFTGHRTIPMLKKWKIEKKLKETLEALIENGYCYFGAGGALGFDTIAAQTVLGLKKKHPEIKLILVLPCKNQTRGWEEKDVSVYESIIEQADKVVYTQEHYDRGCMFKRNRHLVDNSSVCVAYLTEEKGGTAYTVNYANQKGVKVINIAE